MRNVDENDIIILKFLQSDGRISFSQISRETGMPTSTIHDHYNRMVEKGVIKKITVLYDEDKLGGSVKAIVGIETGAKLYSSVAEKLCKINEVTEVFGTTGEFDLMIKVQSWDEDSFRQVLNDIRKIDGVEDIFISSILEIFKEKPQQQIINI
jgi:DNA-binding Lrp family transcriptional regulator